MDSNLQHEDLLIKLRAKLNEDQVKLWEAPFYEVGKSATTQLEDLARRYAECLSNTYEVILEGLQELQTHSIDRSKANVEFTQTGVATLRVRVTVSGEKPKLLKVQIKLDALGSELINQLASELGFQESRLKVIHAGRVLIPSQRIDEQGVKNGVQIMALVMTESVEKIQKEDRLYLEMKSTRDDATLLADDDDDFIGLEDQNGQEVDLPSQERRSLMVGLALAARGAAALRNRDYALALTTLLTADTIFSECRSQILEQVDNWAVLQLDIAWCYLHIGSIQHCSDVQRRLNAAELAFNRTYGQDRGRLIALKGTEANERVLFMRLYLLQGIVSFHQNRRDQARRMLEAAEREINSLRVDESAVIALTELGWSVSAARAGLRASGGDLQQAHAYLERRALNRMDNRSHQLQERQRRAVGVCRDGRALSAELVAALVGMGHSRKAAAKALALKNNNVDEASDMLRDHPDEFSSDSSDEDSETSSFGHSEMEPDSKLVAELEAMGYDPQQARTALKLTKNQMNMAVELLMAGQGVVEAVAEQCSTEPSTSTDGSAAARQVNKLLKDKKRKAKNEALKRLKKAIKGEEDDYLDTSLDQEEDILAQYKSLL